MWATDKLRLLESVRRVTKAPDLLIAEVTQVMAINAQNAEVAAVQAQLAKMARNRILAEGMERTLLNMDERMGDGP